MMWASDRSCAAAFLCWCKVLSTNQCSEALQVEPGSKNRTRAQNKSTAKANTSCAFQLFPFPNLGPTHAYPRLPAKGCRGQNGANDKPQTSRGSRPCERALHKPQSKTSDIQNPKSNTHDPKAKTQNPTPKLESAPNPRIPDTLGDLPNLALFYVNDPGVS